MNDLLVSVIIPTYKSSQTLKRAIDSVLIQKYSLIEIIVVDDNDTNSRYRTETESIMKEYKDDVRIKYIKHERNLNGSAARNTGFKNSSGKYICLLDDDDFFLQNKILYQVELLEKERIYDAAYCWRIVKGEVISNDKVGDLSSDILSLEFTPTTCSLMIRRECYESLKGFDENYYRHQDFEFLLRFFKKYKIGVVNEALIELATNGIDNEPHGKNLNKLKKMFFEQFSNDIERIDNNVSNFRKKVYSKHYSIVFKDHIRHGHLLLAVIIAFQQTFHNGLFFWKNVLVLFFLNIKERF